jgi:hypothetical protein
MLQLECGWCYLWVQFDCGESVTVYWQKGVVGGCNYRMRAEYVLRRTAARQRRMDAMDDRYNYASPLTGHQDLVPNSDAARLRLDPQVNRMMCIVVCGQRRHPPSYEDPLNRSLVSSCSGPSPSSCKSKASCGRSERSRRSRYDAKSASICLNALSPSPAHQTSNAVNLSG